MVLGFTSKIPDDSIQRNFRRMLSEEEIPHRELKNDFPGCGEQQRLERKENQRIVQTFSFLSGSCCYLRYDQYYDSGNTELVLVCRCRMCLRLAGCYGSLF